MTTLARMRELPVPGGANSVAAGADARRATPVSQAEARCQGGLIRPGEMEKMGREVRQPGRELRVCSRRVSALAAVAPGRSRGRRSTLLRKLKRPHASMGAASPRWALGKSTHAVF